MPAGNYCIENKYEVLLVTNFLGSCITKTDLQVDANQIEELLGSVNWDSAKISDIVCLALSKSSHLVTVWYNSKLIGLIRSMDDNCWSANIDCLIVHKNYQNMGVGSYLLKTLLTYLSDVKYISVSPNNIEVIDFYKKFGFVENGILLQLIK